MILLAIILPIDRCRLLGRGSITPISYAFALSRSSTYVLGVHDIARVALDGEGVILWINHLGFL